MCVSQGHGSTAVALQTRRVSPFCQRMIAILGQRLPFSLRVEWRSTITTGSLGFSQISEAFVGQIARIVVETLPGFSML